MQRTNNQLTYITVAHYDDVFILVLNFCIPCFELVLAQAWNPVRGQNSFVLFHAQLLAQVKVDAVAEK